MDNYISTSDIKELERLKFNAKKEQVDDESEERFVRIESLLSEIINSIKEINSQEDPLEKRFDKLEEEHKTLAKALISIVKNLSEIKEKLSDLDKKDPETFSQTTRQTFTSTAPFNGLSSNTPLSPGGFPPSSQPNQSFPPASPGGNNSGFPPPPPF